MKIAVAALLAAVVLVMAPTPRRAMALENGLARTPPMGWNGFNRFTRDVTASIVESEARAIVASGMKQDGYVYVNLDGGWNLLQRNAQGELQPDPSKFPDGIKPVADYVHSLGLKFGIYTDAGMTNCTGTSAGSYGHYSQDAQTFAAWGVDYLKLDSCAIPYQDYPTMTSEQVDQMLVAQMRDALANTGRPITFSVGYFHQVWTWGSTVGNLWRTTPDVHDTFTAVVSNFTGNEALYRYAHPGAWNDPDTLEVGNGGMTTVEDRTQFTLWAEMASPLIAGNDVATMSPTTRSMLTNRGVIAVDQDPLGKQGRVVQSGNGHWVLTKPLAHGARAVVLFNQGDTPARIRTSAARVGLRKAPGYRVQDLWRHRTLRTTGMVRAAVPPHGAVMYRITADRRTRLRSRRRGARSRG